MFNRHSNDIYSHKQEIGRVYLYSNLHCRGRSTPKTVRVVRTFYVSLSVCSNTFHFMIDCVLWNATHVYCLNISTDVAGNVDLAWTSREK